MPFFRKRLHLVLIILLIGHGGPGMAAESSELKPLPDCRYRSESPAAFSDSPPVNEKRVFPNGDLFRPLLADPKQPQFVISRQRVKPNLAGDFVGGWVAYGENFGIFRSVWDRTCDGWQINMLGAVFAQFDLTAESLDLLNADYVIGAPLTFRSGDFSGRLRIYHQSSHLGDEFILGAPGVERLNLSFEELEILFSYEWNRLRAYGGIGFLVHREPELDRFRGQYGTELRLPLYEAMRPRFVPYPIYVVAGTDFKQFKEHDYDLDFSIKAGFELVSNLSDRRLRLLFDFYNGFNPFGQFYDQELKAFGFEINLGF